MKSLFTLRNWLNIDEAAKHLSVLFDEPVAKAELLRLALDGELKLSVLFVNQARAKRGRIVSVDEARIIELPCLNGEKILTYEGEYMGDEKVMELESEVQVLTGVCDLPMIGSEQLDVEHEYQMLTGGPAVEMSNLAGAFVCNDDVYWQVQEHFSKNEYFKAEDLLKPWDNPRNFYPAGKLPEDVVYVVRPTALSDLIAKVQVQQGDSPGVHKESGKAQATIRRAGGRRMSNLWPNWVAELVFHIHENGFPVGDGAAGQEALIATLESSVIQRGGEVPSRTTVQDTVRAVLARYRKAGK